MDSGDHDYYQRYGGLGWVKAVLEELESASKPTLCLFWEVGGRYPKPLPVLQEGTTVSRTFVLRSLRRMYCGDGLARVGTVVVFMQEMISDGS